jgi:hypothetical protein
MGMPPMESRSRVVAHASGKAVKIPPRMPIQKNEEKRFEEPTKSEGVYEG